MAKGIKSKKIDHQEILREVAMNLMRLKQPHRLLNLVARFIDRQIGLTHTSVLLHEPQKDHFALIDSKGNRRYPVGLLKFEREHPFIAWFHRPSKKVRFQDDFIHKPSLRKTLTGQDTKTKLELEELVEDVESSLVLFNAELVVPSYDQKNLIALILLGKKKNEKPFTAAEISFFQTLAHICGIAIKTAQFHESLRKKQLALQRQVLEIERLRQNEKETYRQILRSLAQEIQAKDPYTYGHIHQVEKLGMMVAEELELDLTERRRDILSASLILHDVGKIGIPDKILLKPARLDAEEWEIMKTHVEKGVRILEHLESFRPVAEIIHCHHERYDGVGYPRGLKGEEIPIEARIITVVDAYHAIVSKRLYDDARPVDVAFQELERCAGSQFDPVVVKAFIRAQTRDLERRGVKKPHSDSQITADV